MRNERTEFSKYTGGVKWSGRSREQERYALLEDWERKTTGKREREKGRKEEKEGSKKITVRERPNQGSVEANVSCERWKTSLMSVCCTCVSLKMLHVIRKVSWILLLMFFYFKKLVELL